MYVVRYGDGRAMVSEFSTIGYLLMIVRIVSDCGRYDRLDCQNGRFVASNLPKWQVASISNRDINGYVLPGLNHGGRYGQTTNNKGSRVRESNNSEF